MYRQAPKKRLAHNDRSLRGIHYDANGIQDQAFFPTYGMQFPGFERTVYLSGSLNVCSRRKALTSFALQMRICVAAVCTSLGEAMTYIEKGGRKQEYRRNKGVGGAMLIRTRSLLFFATNKCNEPRRSPRHSLNRRCSITLRRDRGEGF